MKTKTLLMKVYFPHQDFKPGLISGSPVTNGFIESAPHRARAHFFLKARLR
jgi:hypothetical protein